MTVQYKCDRCGTVPVQDLAGNPTTNIPGVGRPDVAMSVSIPTTDPITNANGGTVPVAPFSCTVKVGLDADLCRRCLKDALNLYITALLG